LFPEESAYDLASRICIAERDGELADALVREISTTLSVEYRLEDRYKVGLGSESSRVTAVLATGRSQGFTFNEIIVESHESDLAGRDAVGEKREPRCSRNEKEEKAKKKKKKEEERSRGIFLRINIGSISNNASPQEVSRC